MGLSVFHVLGDVSLPFWGWVVDGFLDFDFLDVCATGPLGRYVGFSVISGYWSILSDALFYRKPFLVNELNLTWFPTQRRTDTSCSCSLRPHDSIEPMHSRYLDQKVRVKKLMEFYNHKYVVFWYVLLNLGCWGIPRAKGLWLHTHQYSGGRLARQSSIRNQSS